MFNYEGCTGHKNNINVQLNAADEKLCMSHIEFISCRGSIFFGNMNRHIKGEEWICLSQFGFDDEYSNNKFLDEMEP